MARVIKVNYTASDDPHFVPGAEPTVLLAPDVTLDIYDDEFVFRFPDAPVSDNQDEADIDLAICKRFAIGILSDYDNSEVDYEWLATVSLLDFVRKLATVKGEV